MPFSSYESKFSHKAKKNDGNRCNIQKNKSAEIFYKKIKKYIGTIENNLSCIKLDKEGLEWQKFKKEQDLCLSQYTVYPNSVFYGAKM